MLDAGLKLKLTAHSQIVLCITNKQNKFHTHLIYKILTVLYLVKLTCPISSLHILDFLYLIHSGKYVHALSDYYLAHQLNTWSKVLLEKVTVTQVVNKFQLHDIHMFTTTITRVLQPGGWAQD